jgi:hypothetical protein
MDPFLSFVAAPVVDPDIVLSGKRHGLSAPHRRVGFTAATGNHDCGFLRQSTARGEVCYWQLLLLAINWTVKLSEKKRESQGEIFAGKCDALPAERGNVRLSKTSASHLHLIAQAEA